MNGGIQDGLFLLEMNSQKRMTGNTLEAIGKIKENMKTFQIYFRS